MNYMPTNIETIKTELEVESLNNLLLEKRVNQKSRNHPARKSQGPDSFTSEFY